MTRVDVLTIEIDSGYLSSKRIRKSTRENNVQVLQIKIFVESFFMSFIVPSNASRVRIMYCQGDSLF